MKGGPCMQCRHFDGRDPERDVCPAYPYGIPDRLFLGGGEHETIQPDQVGDVVFQQRDPRV